VPRRFPRITDANGCRWGLDKNGVLQLSGGPAQPTLSLFKQAGHLSVNGQAFETQEAATAPDESRVRLTGTAAGTPVVRDVWIDRERGGSRWADTFTNAKDEPLALKISLSTVFDQPVPAIHRVDGSPVPDDASEAAEPALGFLQNQPEGMSSAIILVGDPKIHGLAKWKGRKNADAHTFEWLLEVPPNASATLVSWIIQRPTLGQGEIKAALDPFVRNNRLLRPNLERVAIDSMANFPARGLIENDAIAGSADPGHVLAAVERFADDLGVSRGEADLYYMNAKSVLEGKTSGGALQMDSRFGSLTVPMDEVAAVQGGGGRGRWPRVFLRDGHVLSGALRLPDWKISGSKGWAITLNPDTLEALVLRVSPADGAAETAPQFLAQLTSGETLPVRLPADARLCFATPWGPLETPASEITGLWRVRQPAPATLLSLRDGTRLTVMTAPGKLAATNSRLGAITLDATDLAALWPPGSELPDPESGAEELAALDEVPSSPSSLALLRGSSVLAVSLAEPSISLVSGGTETQLSTEDVATLARAEGSSAAAPEFSIGLVSGALFEGTLRGGTVSLKSPAGATWAVPLSHFLGWRRGGSAAR